ncbi:hypothetical protein EET67_06135 [Pseudaminobacter arsenicus]|uniref:Uncharacterized protein n=1 Tax=Borborobacter arsenicus TaxID=1851146 RepID=A0A432V948_9HYPH|nr:hypothetical protein [Pseudaminobacter arsenicus]RUM98681.1 hypothetical protein EET67_06135 [Pseudaminobacter arsenicus]
MTLHANTRIIIGLLAMGTFTTIAPAALGQSDPWRIVNGRDGAITASVVSIGTLSVGSSRVIEYHPTFTIGCRPTEGGSWSQSVQLRDPVAGDQSVDLSLRIDGSVVSEQWALGFQKRSFSREGKDGIARLLGARRLKIVWRFGFLAGNGEADFNLAGLRDAVARIGRMCGDELS